MSSLGLKVQCLASSKITEQSLKEPEQQKDDAVNQECDTDPRDDRNITEAQAGDAAVQKEEDELAEQDGVLPKLLSQSASDSEESLNTSSDGSSTSYTRCTPKLIHTSCIQEAQLSPDGTCILTSDHSRTFSVYPIDTNILTGSAARPLRPYALFASPNPIWAFTANPLFNVSDANSTHVLISRRDSYITLHNALWDINQPYHTDRHDGNNTPVNIAKPVSFYKLIDHLTEAIDAPISLTYSNSGTYFFAGKQNGIAIFDLEYMSDPIQTIPTIPSKRSKLKGGGCGFKGWISALSLSLPTTLSGGGMLAAGARTRYVGIYDATSGEEVTQFSLPGTVDGKKLRNENLRHVMGDGVSYLKWSPCAKYLYVAERNSDVILIYDVRNFSLALGYCAGRKAITKQKLGIDVWNAGASPHDIEGISHEVWAGGTDGMVRVWRDPYRREGPVEPNEVVQIGDAESPVVATLVHPSGSLAVAACGKVEVGEDMSAGKLRRGGGLRPRYKEWGSLDVLGLS
jgi:WD40 repeat protein